jgi:hypothetical protein
MTLGIGAWSIKVHAMTGRLLFINDANSRNLYYGNNPWTPLYHTWWYGSHKAGEPGVPDAFVVEKARIGKLPSGTERDTAFTQAVLAHIRARPDLFAVRTLARLRTFFAFDTFAAAQARAAGRRVLMFMVLACDAFLWLVILFGGVVGLLGWPLDRAAWVTLIAIALYAAPYFASFSHPTYHAPVAPLFGVWASRAMVRRFNGEPMVAAGRWLWVGTLLVVLGAVQIEWVIRQTERPM